MPYWIDGKAQGLLAHNKLRTTVDTEFPDLTSQIQKVDPKDARMNTALFRDYSMLSAGYMLESCHNSYLATKYYGLGSDHIPKNLAVPMKMLADRLEYGQPLLEYACGYALNNWKLVKDTNPNSLDYHND